MFSASKAEFQKYVESNSSKILEKKRVFDIFTPFYKRIVEPELLAPYNSIYSP
jgi:hypothetical protein